MRKLIANLQYVTTPVLISLSVVGVLRGGDWVWLAPRCWRPRSSPIPYSSPTPGAPARTIRGVHWESPGSSMVCFT